MDDKYQLGAKVAGIGLGSVDYDSDTIVLDARAASLFDLEPDVATLRADLHARIHPSDWPSIKPAIARLLSPMEWA